MCASIPVMSKWNYEPWLFSHLSIHSPELERIKFDLRHNTVVWMASMQPLLVLWLLLHMTFDSNIDAVVSHKDRERKTHTLSQNELNAQTALAKSAFSFFFFCFASKYEPLWFGDISFSFRWPMYENHFVKFPRIFAQLHYLHLH